jgi:hypothetical protein
MNSQTVLPYLLFFVPNDNNIYKIQLHLLMAIRADQTAVKQQTMGCNAKCLASVTL